MNLNNQLDQICADIIALGLPEQATSDLIDRISSIQNDLDDLQQEVQGE